MTESAPWKEYEQAVTQFLQAIGENAQVTHDVKLPDAETGLPRQRDVWIEWSLAGHFPVKALVSCKHLARALDQQDIDHFRGEMLSARANVGIIYSKAGFRSGAIQKARELGFHCCRLYQTEPPDVPEILEFGLAYNFRPEYRLSVGPGLAEQGVRTWGEVFALPAAGRSRTVKEDLVRAYEAVFADRASMWQLAKNGLALRSRICSETLPAADVYFEMRFRAYRARLEYTLIKGSYNVTSGSFVGSQSAPWIKASGSSPGEGWEEVEEIPDEQPVPLLAMFHTYRLQDLLEECSEDSIPGAETAT